MLSTSGLVHEAEAGRRRGAGAGPRMNSLLRPVRAGQPGPRPLTEPQHGRPGLSRCPRPALPQGASRQSGTALQGQGAGRQSGTALHGQDAGRQLGTC